LLERAAVHRAQVVAQVHERRAERERELVRLVRGRRSARGQQRRRRQRSALPTSSSVSVHRFPSASCSPAEWRRRHGDPLNYQRRSAVAIGRASMEVPMQAYFRGVVFAIALISLGACRSGYHRTFEAAAAAPDARLTQRIAEARDAQAEAAARLHDARAYLRSHDGADAPATQASPSEAAALADAAVWEMRRA